ncbi:MAG TPA: hypothetical protein VG826_14165 [Pirellulales bacterium]|nr:hypothetical protein [Pirellulales bacterium]
MNKILSAAACGLLLTAVPALAQGPRSPQRSTVKPAATEKDAGISAESLSMTQMTPEMWLYTQELRRREDPKDAVRRKAEYRTAERMRRIASREWFGYSNSRPVVNPDPWTAGYSAHWSANNAMRPDQWIGNSRSAVRR